MVKNFLSFLFESNIDSTDFARILGAFEKRAHRTLGKIYRSGGSAGTSKIAGYEIIQYFFGSGRSFQFRLKSGRLEAVDVWDHYALNVSPAYTIDVSKLDANSLIGSIDKIVKLIHKPVVTELAITVAEDVELMEMAKRVSGPEFYDMVVKKFGTDKAASLRWEDIASVAKENDVLIPAYMRDPNQKIGRGLFSAVPQGEISMDNADQDAEKAEPTEATKGAAKGGKQDPIMYIKVTAQDPTTKKFIATAKSPEAQKLYQQLQKAVAGPATEAEVKDPSTLYGHMAQLVEMACKGTLRSLLIYGGPGTGKTFTIMETIKRLGLQSGRDYVKLSGKASPVEIYKTLFMYRDGGMVLFDDLDSMWRNEDATNILKAALDTSPVREISWVSNQTINVSRMDDERKKDLFARIDAAINGETYESEDDEDEEGSRKKKDKNSITPDKIKYPSTFNFTGRVVFISNLKKSEFDSAILSRSAKINMDLTPAQVLERMRSILPTLGGTDVPVQKKKELLDHLLHLHGAGELDAVTMREFTKGMDILRSGVENWRDLIVYA